MNLYINSCVRNESRTDWLARKLLATLGEYEEIKLSDECLKPLSRDVLQLRTELINAHDYSSDMFDYARQFAQADNIVISAPFWDLSFPASLKVYLENIYVTGLVSQHGADGRPEGLCKGNTLYYVTTAGGPYNRRYSYDYINDLAVNYFGIKKTELIVAEMLDIQGSDTDKILNDCVEKYNL